MINYIYAIIKDKVIEYSRVWFATSLVMEVVVMSVYEAFSLMIAFGLLIATIVKNNDVKK